MELEHFIMKDMGAFLDRRRARDVAPITATPRQAGVLTPEELAAYSLRRDYSKELESALKEGSFPKAKRILLDLKVELSSYPPDAPELLEGRRILQRLYQRFQRALEEARERQESLLAEELKNIFPAPPPGLAPHAKLARALELLEEAIRKNEYAAAITHYREARALLVKGESRDARSARRLQELYATLQKRLSPIVQHELHERQHEAHPLEGAAATASGGAGEAVRGESGEGLRASVTGPPGKSPVLKLAGESPASPAREGGERGSAKRGGQAAPQHPPPHSSSPRGGRSGVAAERSLPQEKSIPEKGAGGTGRRVREESASIRFYHLLKEAEESLAESRLASAMIAYQELRDMLPSLSASDQEGARRRIAELRERIGRLQSSLSAEHAHEEHPGKERAGGPKSGSRLIEEEERRLAGAP